MSRDVSLVAHKLLTSSMSDDVTSTLARGREGVLPRELQDAQLSPEIELLLDPAKTSQNNHNSLGSC